MAKLQNSGGALLVAEAGVAFLTMVVLYFQLLEEAFLDDGKPGLCSIVTGLHWQRTVCGISDIVSRVAEVSPKKQPKIKPS